MALLDLITNVADKAGYTVDRNLVITSVNPTTRQLLALLNTVNQELMESYSWNQLLRSAQITLVNGQAEYAVPDDFSYHHHDTFWNQTEQWQTYGALTTQEYAYLKGYNLDVSIRERFIIRGIKDKKIEIDPVPTSSEAGQVIYYLYQANKYYSPVHRQLNTSYMTGDLVRVGNNIYFASNGGTTGTVPPTHTSGFEDDGTVTWLYWDKPMLTFKKDTDETILPQRILEQGLLEAFNDTKSLNYKPMYKEMVLNEFRRNKPAQEIYVDNMPEKYAYGIGGKFYFGTRI